MKIVQAVGWYYPTTVGGTEAYVASLASRLAREGHTVEIVAPDPQIDAARAYAHDDVTVHRFPIARSLTRDEAQGRAPVRGADWLHR